MTSRLTQKIGEFIDLYLSKSKGVLIDAMRHAAVPPGKCVRARLIQEISQEKEGWLAVAAAVEMVHTYTLIHDDLPMFDNDDYRRGRASCHKQFGEPVAIVAGNSLLTLAFQVIAESDLLADTKTEIIKILSRAIGYQGVMEGQVLDLLQSDYYLTIKLKTAIFFAACAEIGGVISGLRDSSSLLREFGLQFGLAFQIIDDLADQDSSICADHLRTKLRYVQKSLESIISEIGFNSLNSLVDSLKIEEVLKKSVLDTSGLTTTPQGDEE